MTSPYIDFQRDGMKKIIDFGRTLCRLVQTFKPIIIVKYADKPTIIALIVAIESVCALLPEAQNDFLALDLNQSEPPEDTGEMSGIDPAAPPAPDPNLT